MALQGNEVVLVTGVLQNGAPSGQQFPATTQQIADLGHASGGSGFTAVNPPSVILDGATDVSAALQAVLDTVAAAGGGTVKLISDVGFYLASTATLGSYTHLDLTECPTIFGKFGGFWTAGDIVPSSGKNLVRNITIHGCNYPVRARYITAHDTAVLGQNVVQNVQAYDFDGTLYVLDGGPNNVVQGMQLRNVTSPTTDQGTSVENTIFDYAPGYSYLSAYLTNIYYPAIPAVSLSNKTMTAGRLYAVGPFTAQATIVISKLGVNVVTGSAVGTHVALGVYSDAGNAPSQLIGGVTGLALTDSSGVDAEATGLAIPIVKGSKYWLVADFEGTPVITGASSSTSLRYALVTSTGSPAVLVKKTAAYGSSLPATFPSVTSSDFAGETAPHLWFRF